MVRAVIFDLDNTLIDFMHMKRTSISAAVESMVAAGLPLSNKAAEKKIYALYDKYGIENQQIFQKLLKQELGAIDYRILATGIVSYRQAQSGVLKPYASVVPVLIKLRERGLKLAIVSDAPRLKAWIRLVELGIQDFFDVVITYDDTKKLKPHPTPFKAALTKLKIPASECLMVGDNAQRDVKGAKSLGMKTALAKYGTTFKITDKPDYLLHRIEDVLKVIP